jgi:hypothetical protein
MMSATLRPHRLSDYLDRTRGLCGLPTLLSAGDILAASRADSLLLASGWSGSRIVHLAESVFRTVTFSLN